MSRPVRIGSVCSGYGGLDMAVAQVFGGEVAWFFEFEAAPSAILAFHWPETPNYGDLTKANWDRIERVRVMCGGTPCQDLSGAGKRAGMTEGTRSNLWVQMREGIAIQQPDYVVWENVRGAYSAGADSEVEREEGLLGGTPGGSLRALGRVLGDLSSLGYDAEVVPLRASDVGAPHARYRVFVIARRQDLTDSESWGWGLRVAEDIGSATGDVNSSGDSNSFHIADTASVAGSVRNRDDVRARRGTVERASGSGGSAVEDAYIAARSEWGQSAPGETESRRSRADVSGRGGASATDTDNRGRGKQQSRGPEPEKPRVANDAIPSTDTDSDVRRFLSGVSPVEEEPGGWASDGPVDSGDERSAQDWGPYRSAIERWERVLGRLAPPATQLSEGYIKRLRRRLDGKNKRPVGMRGSLAPVYELSPLFVEWMMGLPEGHVVGETEVQWRERLAARRSHHAAPVGLRGSIARRGPFLTRNGQLKALGNGVVTQQAVAAIRIGLARFAADDERERAA